MRALRHVRTLSGVRRTHTQKLSADGAQQWGGGSPVVLMDTTSLQQGNFPPLMSDGAGGALYWWYEVSGVALQCRAQHLDASGAELFPHNGAAAATQAGRYRVSPTIAYLPGSQTTIMFWGKILSMGNREITIKSIYRPKVNVNINLF